VGHPQQGFFSLRKVSRYTDLRYVGPLRLAKGKPEGDTRFLVWCDEGARPPLVGHPQQSFFSLRKGLTLYEPALRETLTACEGQA
jgi:hypothetical protein